MKNYYEILGVDPEVSDTALKQRFRKLAFRYHPDQNPDPAAHERFVEINEAYETLIDPQKRVLYKYRLLRWQKERNAPPPPPSRPTSQPTQPPGFRPQYRPAPAPPRPPAIHPAIHVTARIARLLAAAAFVFGLVLSVDFFWQQRMDELTVESIELLPPTARRSIWTMQIQTPRATFPMSVLKEEVLRVGDVISIRKSRIFGVVTRVGAKKRNGTLRWFAPHVGIYGPPFIIVILMIGTSLAIWRDEKNVMFNTLMGILLVFLTIFSMGILRNS